MSTGDMTRVLGSAPHVCPCCALPIMQPVAWEYASEGHWLVRLLCPSCGWIGDRLLSQTLLERLGEELGAGMSAVAHELARMTRRNMQDYAERFAAALEGDAILPEDF
jgi:hypothetical protein